MTRTLAVALSILCLALAAPQRAGASALEEIDVDRALAAVAAPGVVLVDLYADW